MQGYTYGTGAAIDAAFAKVVVVLKVINCLSNIAEVEDIL